MIIPSVGLLESAMAELAVRDPKVIAAEATEFHRLGLLKLHRMHESLRPTLVPLEETLAEGILVSSLPEYEAMLAGYLFGLEAARVLLAEEKGRDL
jgi:hypothetical protein